MKFCSVSSSRGHELIGLRNANHLLDAITRLSDNSSATSNCAEEYSETYTVRQHLADTLSRELVREATSVDSPKETRAKSGGKDGKGNNAGNG